MYYVGNFSGFILTVYYLIGSVTSLVKRPIYGLLRPGRYNIKSASNLENAIEYFNKSYLLEPAIDILSSKAWVLYDMNEIEASEETHLLMFNSDPTQDRLNQILDFYLKTKNLENFNFYINQPVKDGQSFMRDGYMILRDYVFRLADIKSLAHKYSLKYSENEILWFKQTFNEYAKE